MIFKRAFTIGRLTLVSLALALAGCGASADPSPSHASSAAGAGGGTIPGSHPQAMKPTAGDQAQVRDRTRSDPVETSTPRAAPLAGQG